MSDVYRKLLEEVQPRAINDEAEAERARAQLHRLAALKAAQGDAIGEMISLLSTLLMAYEQELKWDREWERRAPKALLDELTAEAEKLGLYPSRE